MALINQPKMLVASEGYNMAISINITVKRMSAPLKGNVGKYVGEGVAVSERERESMGDRSVRLLCGPTEAPLPLHPCLLFLAL
jgi:hypothetical protein